MISRLAILAGVSLLIAGQALAQKPAYPTTLAQAAPAPVPDAAPPPPAPVAAPPAAPVAAATGAAATTASDKAATYTEDELVHRVSDFMGVTAETAGGIIEKTFKDQGRPTAYIAGEEGSAAFVAGLRYGKGLLYMKGRPAMTVYWQGPSVGFDVGGNGSRVFVLCYNLQYPDAVFRRFPGVDGSAYFVGGLGVNYQRADDITMAPIRAGLGFRLGANVGYLSYSRKRNILPF